MQVLIGSDHAGFELKDYLLSKIKQHELIDKGVYDNKSCDYPDIAKDVCSEILQKNVKRAILICATGVGMSISANRFKGIRAVLADNIRIAKKSRDHNDSNVLVLGAHVIAKELAKDIILEWLNTPFSEGARHIRRIKKIEELVC